MKRITLLAILTALISVSPLLAAHEGVAAPTAASNTACVNKPANPSKKTTRTSPKPTISLVAFVCPQVPNAPTTAETPSGVGSGSAVRTGGGGTRSTTKSPPQSPSQTGGSQAAKPPNKVAGMQAQDPPELARALVIGGAALSLLLIIAALVILSLMFRYYASSDFIFRRYWGGFGGGSTGWDMSKGLLAFGAAVLLAACGTTLAGTVIYWAEKGIG